MTSFNLNEPPSVRKAQPPERIYGWMESQMSLARFYGGISLNGTSYVIDYDDPREPLVRKDVHDAEYKAKKKVNKKETQPVAKIDDLFGDKA